MEKFTGETWEDNIKTDLKKVKRRTVDSSMWHRSGCSSYENTVMDFQVP